MFSLLGCICEFDEAPVTLLPKVGLLEIVSDILHVYLNEF